jgi:hypothetical protein
MPVHWELCKRLIKGFLPNLYQMAKMANRQLTLVEFGVYYDDS